MSSNMSGHDSPNIFTAVTRRRRDFDVVQPSIASTAQDKRPERAVLERHSRHGEVRVQLNSIVLAFPSCEDERYDYVDTCS